MKNEKQYQYKLAGIPTSLDDRKLLTGHISGLPVNELINALRGLNAKHCNLSVTIDVTDNLNRLMKIELTNTATWQQTILRY